MSTASGTGGTGRPMPFLLRALVGFLTGAATSGLIGAMLAINPDMAASSAAQAVLALLIHAYWHQVYVHRQTPVRH